MLALHIELPSPVFLAGSKSSTPIMAAAAPSPLMLQKQKSGGASSLGHPTPASTPLLMGLAELPMFAFADHVAVPPAALSHIQDDKPEAHQPVAEEAEFFHFGDDLLSMPFDGDDDGDDDVKIDDDPFFLELPVDVAGNLHRVAFGGFQVGRYAREHQRALRDQEAAQLVGWMAELPVQVIEPQQRRYRRVRACAICQEHPKRVGQNMEVNHYCGCIHCECVSIFSSCL
jgi:hypothetical protein